MCISTYRDGGDVASSGYFILDYWRGAGGGNGPAKHQGNKDFAIAYNQIMCLKEGWYRLHFNVRGANNNQHLQGYLRVNGANTVVLEDTSQSSERGMLDATSIFFLKRGDLIGVYRDAGDFEGGTSTENHFSITRL